MIVGTEWLIEAADCDPEKLRDETVLRAIFERVVDDLDLKVLDSIWHSFPGAGGITGLAALTESHLACHTYPEHRTATFNLYCCRARPEWDWTSELSSALGARLVSVSKMERGENSNAAVPAAVLRPSRPQRATFDKEIDSRKFVTYGDVKIRERGRLPHWEKENGIYFVTFRLADSLPQQLLAKLESERQEAEKAITRLQSELSAKERRKLEWLFSEKVDEYLDKNYGECLLGDPGNANVVADSIKHFDGQRYNILSWCVMPNHVHVVVKPKQRNKLNEILHSWKSFSAHEINKLTGRNGELWQREYYDHLVRDESDLDRVISYVLDNPSKAGIKNWPWVYGQVKYRTTDVIP